MTSSPTYQTGTPQRAGEIGWLRVDTLRNGMGWVKEVRLLAASSGDYSDPFPYWEGKKTDTRCAACSSHRAHTTNFHAHALWKPSAARRMMEGVDAA